MKYFSALIFLLFSCSGFSQSLEVGAWLGGTNSFNDINTTSSFETMRPAGGVLGKYNFDPRISAELMVSYGRTFSADQKFLVTDYQTQRNEANRTSSLDIQVAGEFNFLPFSRELFQSKTRYTPYLSAGIGVSLLKPEIYSRETNGWLPASVVLTEDARDFNSFQFTIPLAAGVKYKLNHSFNLAAEFGSRILFSDYYDDLSTVYNLQGVENGPGTITTVGRQRGDRSKNDVYNLFGVQMTYIIPFADCP